MTPAPCRPRRARPPARDRVGTLPGACGRGVNGCTGAFQALGAGSSPVARFVRSHSHGEWRSLVAHPAGGRAVAGSNPVSPIETGGPHLRAFCVPVNALDEALAPRARDAHWDLGD